MNRLTLNTIGLSLMIFSIGCEEKMVAPSHVIPTKGDHPDVEAATQGLSSSTGFNCDKWSGVGRDIENPAYNWIVTILNSSDPESKFKKVYDEGTPAAKLYALCGLYFCSETAFKEALKLAESNPSKVFFRDVDIAYDRPLMEIVRCTDDDRVSLLYGELLPDYIARKGKLGVLDIAGGGIPVRLLDETWLDFQNARDFPESIDVRSERLSFIDARSRLYTIWRAKRVAPTHMKNDEAQNR